MGLFRDLGKRVERFKRKAEQASEEEASHECRECGTLLYVDRDTCPECGSEAVARREPDETEQ